MYDNIIDMFVEGNLPKSFNLDINDKEYTIFRNNHLLQNRVGDNKPKDFKMSKAKYKDVFSKIRLFDLIPNIPYTVTWKQNSKSNAISFKINKKNTITVFGAIHNSSKDENSLYPKAINRINI